MKVRTKGGIGTLNCLNYKFGNRLRLLNQYLRILDSEVYHSTRTTESINNTSQIRIFSLLSKRIVNSYLRIRRFSLEWLRIL